MRAMAIALALGASIALCAVDSPASAQVGNGTNYRVIRVPRGACGPFWIPDYISVPRYCYDPRDDRIDTAPTRPPEPTTHLEYSH